MKHISITVNEQPREIPEGLLLGALRDEAKPGADVLVVNGFPTDPGTALKAGDRVVLIKRGEMPADTELESLMVARHTPGVHARMKNGTIGIAGLGGLGSNVAIALARMGVGTLILVDFDIVEPSNLNRQQYFIEHIGTHKTEAMAAMLAKINPYLTVEIHTVMLDPDNVPVIFKRADVVIECFDRADQKVMLIETVADTLPDAFIIGASGLAGYGDNNSIQTMQLGEKVYVVGDLVNAVAPGRGLMAPRVSIAAGQQANLAVSLLMDPHQVTL